MKLWHVVAIDGWQVIIDKACINGADEASEALSRLKHARAFGQLTADERKALLAEDADSHAPGTLGYRMANMGSSYEVAKFIEDAEKVKDQKVIFKREYY